MNRDVWNAAKNNATKTDLLDSKNGNMNNKGEDLREKDEENIDLPTTDLYLHTIAIICMN